MKNESRTLTDFFNFLVELNKKSPVFSEESHDIIQKFQNYRMEQVKISKQKKEGVVTNNKALILKKETEIAELGELSAKYSKQAKMTLNGVASLKSMKAMSAMLDRNREISELKSQK